MPDSSPEDVVVDSATSQDQPVAASVDTGSKDGTAAASSTAEAKPAETTFDRINAIVNKVEVSPTSKEPGTAADAEPVSTAKTDDDDLSLSPDELKGLQANTQKAIEARVGRFKSKIAAKESEIESLKPRAAEYDKIETFIRNAGLSAQDVGGTLQIAALLRSDPKGARERLLPIMANLDRILGETLPTELQARVDQGFLTLEDAQALNRASADAKLAKTRLNEQTERQQQESAANDVKTQTDATVTAIETWEKQKAERDPDWTTKRAEVAEQVELAIERKARELGKPYFPTPAEAVKYSEDALETVNKRYKRFAPKPKAIDPPVAAGASPRSVAAPKNTLDIVRRIAGGSA